ncbi:unnamed protein product [Dicrocoelium dendriticum]|nr:unnamed protein product [Dicrocoelium dendriticum]
MTVVIYGSFSLFLNIDYEVRLSYSLVVFSLIFHPYLMVFGPKKLSVAYGLTWLSNLWSLKYRYPSAVYSLRTCPFNNRQSKTNGFFGCAARYLWARGQR